MMRYDIEETAVYEKVRTVVWEDGAARPLLPDPTDCFEPYHGVVAASGPVVPPAFFKSRSILPT